MTLQRLGQFNPGPLDPDPLQRLIDETPEGEQGFLGAVDVSGAVVAHGPSGAFQRDPYTTLVLFVTGGPTACCRGRFVPLAPT